MAVPIKVGEAVIGVLTFDSTAKNFFNEQSSVILRPYVELLGSTLAASPPNDAENLITSVNKYRQQVLILAKDTPPEVDVLHEIAAVLSQLKYKPLLVKTIQIFQRSPTRKRSAFWPTCLDS